MMGNSSQANLEICEPAIPVASIDTSAWSLREGTLKRPHYRPSHERNGNLLQVGVIGYGYWGPNIVRNFHMQEFSRVAMVCDSRTDALSRASRAYPETEMVDDYTAMLRSPHIDVIAIVTPVWTHFELAKAALRTGSMSSWRSRLRLPRPKHMELIELAERRKS